MWIIKIADASFIDIKPEFTGFPENVFIDFMSIKEVFKKLN